MARRRLGNASSNINNPPPGISSLRRTTSSCQIDSWSKSEIRRRTSDWDINSRVTAGRARKSGSATTRSTPRSAAVTASGPTGASGAASQTSPDSERDGMRTASGSTSRKRTSYPKSVCSRSSPRPATSTVSGANRSSSVIRELVNQSPTNSNGPSRPAAARVAACLPIRRRREPDLSGAGIGSAGTVRPRRLPDRYASGGNRMVPKACSRVVAWWSSWSWAQWWSSWAQWCWSWTISAARTPTRSRLRMLHRPGSREGGRDLGSR